MLQHFFVALIILAATGGVWRIVVFLADRSRRAPDENPQPDPEVSVLLAKARAATEFVPRFDAFVGEGDDVKLTITGGSGDYAVVAAKQSGSPDPDNGLWSKSLRQWLDRGAHVNYILSAPTDDGVALLGRLAREYPSHFKLFVLSEVGFENQHDRDNVRELISFHPSLLENRTTGVRAMWIENDHPPSSTIARQVEYVAPADASHDARFDSLNALLSGYMVKCMPSTELRGVNASA